MGSTGPRWGPSPDFGLRAVTARFRRAIAACARGSRSSGARRATPRRWPRPGSTPISENGERYERLARWAPGSPRGRKARGGARGDRGRQRRDRADRPAGEHPRRERLDRGGAGGRRGARLRGRGRGDERLVAQDRHGGGGIETAIRSLDELDRGRCARTASGWVRNSSAARDGARHPRPRHHHRRGDGDGPRPDRRAGCGGRAPRRCGERDRGYLRRDRERRPADGGRRRRGAQRAGR